MLKSQRKDQGSILIMAVVFSFIIILIGISFLTMASNVHDRVSYNIARSKSYFDAFAGKAHVDYISGHQQHGWKKFYTDGGNRRRTEYIDYDFTGLDQGDMPYGEENFVYITGFGKSEYDGGEITSRVKIKFGYETYADYLYLSHRERDTSRHEIIRFWTPDTLDGKVHSNDTIHIQSSADQPRFIKRVTTTMNYIDPPNNHARFDEKWGWRKKIVFPDQADILRDHASLRFSTSMDTMFQIVLDGDLILERKCWPRSDSTFHDSIYCYPEVISGANHYSLEGNVPTGVIFVDGKLWVSASRGRGDIMDGPIPERRTNHPQAYISSGFAGRLTILASDTLFITDNIIYEHARPNNTVPPTMGECPDILGLVSEKFIMIHRQVRDTVYVTAALAAVAGSVSIQDIYWYTAPGWLNPKQSFFLYGSLAQRNRGIVHSTYPCNNSDLCERGFREKDYHYDVRLKKYPPPFYLPTLNQNVVYVMGYQDE